MIKSLAYYGCMFLCILSIALSFYLLDLALFLVGILYLVVAVNMK